MIFGGILCCLPSSIWDFRMAVVMGISLSNQIGPCHSEFFECLPILIRYFAASKRFGDFFWDLFLSVRMFLALIAFFLH
uniref:Uncharacterized protein LOC105135610 isoform X2 n=1 Tax=Rhizophora mucronata TaxID=61149 RepID=A0A2P2KCN0_RHIMU